MDANSAAGPDGYTGYFYRTCWDVIKIDFHTAVYEFFLQVLTCQSPGYAL